MHAPLSRNADITSLLRSWDYLSGDCVSAFAKQVSHNDISKATKDPVNPVNQPQGPQHPTKRWPYSVIGGWGGCADPRWVASFTKVSFVNQSATGHPRNRPFQTLPCRVFGEFIQSRNTRPNMHRLTPLWKNSPPGLNYSWHKVESTTLSHHIHSDLYDPMLHTPGKESARATAPKSRPADYTESRRSHRRLYSTTATSSENKAI